MRILAGLGWSSLWSVFAILSLITITWIAGPAIAIGDFKPLAAVWARVLVTVFICVLFLALYLYKLYKTRKLNQHVLEEIQASELSSDSKKNTGSSTALQEQFSHLTLVMQRYNAQQSKSFLERIFAFRVEV